MKRIWEFRWKWRKREKITMETDLMACRIFCHLIVKIKMLLELLIIWHRLKLAKLFLSFQCECGSKLCTHFKSSSQFRLFSTKHQKPENPLTDNLISGCERNVYAMRKVRPAARPPTSIDFEWIHNILHLPSAQTHAAAAADELPKLYHFLFACFFLVFLWHYCRITHTLEMASSECGCFEIHYSCSSSSSSMVIAFPKFP